MKKLLIRALLLPAMFITTVAFSQKAIMTFNLDMNGLSFSAKDTTLNVTIKGDVEPINWVTGLPLTDSDNDGVYSVSVTFDSKTGKELTYKYVLNNVEWELGENLKVVIKPGASLKSNFRYHQRTGNPFRKFIGEWTLKNDTWESGYNGKIDIVKIPDHYTLCKEVNTDNSLLWVIESPNTKGHIFWSFNSSEKKVQWLSSFYSYRSGVGQGTVSPNGDLTFKVAFEGEPAGTYGLYTYRWISDNEYELKSVQYDDKDQPTGSSYGGTFVRMLHTKN